MGMDLIIIIIIIKSMVMGMVEGGCFIWMGRHGLP